MFKHAKLWAGAAVAAAAVAATLPAATAGAVTASLPAPTLISSQVLATDFSGTGTAPCTPAQNPPAPTDPCQLPAVLVAQGAAFTLRVHLTSAGAEAAFTKDTALTLTAPGPGVLTPTTVTMPRGTSVQDFAVSYAPYANNLTVTAGVGGKGKTSTIVSTPSNSFDVLESVKFRAASLGTAFEGGTGLAECAAADAANPICGDVILPNGANSNVVLTSGSCAGLNCNTKGRVAQVVADLSQVYTRSAPATMIIRCYRTICGKGGVNGYHAVASQVAGGALATVPACPSKGVIGADQSYCTDYVQSTRDGVDNLLLYVLFTDDFRASI